MAEEAQKSEIHETTADARDDQKRPARAEPDHEQRERLARKEMQVDKNDPDESSFGGVLDLDRPDAV